MRRAFALLFLTCCAETITPAAQPVAPNRETAAQATARAIAEDEARKIRELEDDARAAAAEREEQEQRAAARTEAAAAREREAQAKREELAREVEAHAGTAISAIMCSVEGELRELRAKLDRENRVEAVGGVRDLRARNEIASDIVDDTEELKGWAAALKRRGAGRTTCKAVAGVEACRRGGACADADRGPARVWAEAFDMLWGDGSPPARR